MSVIFDGPVTVMTVTTLPSQAIFVGGQFQNVKGYPRCGHAFISPYGDLWPSQCYLSSSASPTAAAWVTELGITPWCVVSYGINTVLYGAAPNGTTSFGPASLTDLITNDAGGNVDGLASTGSGFNVSPKIIVATEPGNGTFIAAATSSSTTSYNGTSIRGLVRLAFNGLFDNQLCNSGIAVRRIGLFIRGQRPDSRLHIRSRHDADHFCKIFRNSIAVEILPVARFLGRICFDMDGFRNWVFRPP